jgi:hypothetical protein
VPKNWGVKDDFVSSSQTKSTTRERSKSLPNNAINSNELRLDEMPDLDFFQEPIGLDSSNSKEKEDKKNTTKPRSKSLSATISSKVSDLLKFNKSQDKSKK